MLKKYKGWNIEFTGHGYELTRIAPVNGEKITKRTKTQEQAKTVITNEEARIAREEEARVKAERERIVEKHYVVHLKGGEEVTFHFMRGPSGAFAYSNQTSVTVHENDRFLGIVDTRYDHGVLTDFSAWCVDYMKNYIDPAHEPQINEI